MIKILTVVGARPQIIKAAAVSRAIRQHFSLYVEEIIVHTGQHYDENMSEVFFRELEVPMPDYNLEVGSGLHGAQTAKMTEGLEKVMLEVKPHFIILYGDTNSTLAGAIAASKLRIPIAHVEAGLRSKNKNMPEEVNRILCDHVATLLFSPTQSGLDNLLREGFSLDNAGPYTANNPRVYHCGDVMYDNTLYFSLIAEQQSAILADNDLEAGQYILATIHRDHNTDNPLRLNQLFQSLLQITGEYSLPVVLPLHPRTATILEKNLLPATFEQLRRSLLIRLVPPASFFDMMMLEKHALLIMTDSGGVQKESYFFGKPCIILRPETEWLEILQAGSAIVTDADPRRILEAFEHFLQHPPASFPPIFGNGKAAEFICQEIMKTCE